MKAKKGLNSKPIILDELGEVRIWFKWWRNGFLFRKILDHFRFDFNNQVEAIHGLITMILKYTLVGEKERFCVKNTTDFKL